MTVIVQTGTVQPGKVLRTAGGVTIFESAVLAHAAYSHDVLATLKNSASFAELWRAADYFSLTQYGTTLHTWIHHMPSYLRVAALSEDAIWRKADGNRRASRLFGPRDDVQRLFGRVPDLQLPKIDSGQNYGFFVGAAWADELLSDKLSRAIWVGLRRLGFDSFGRKRGELGPHPDSFFGLPRFQDPHHDDFQEDWILPIVNRDPEAAYAIWVGLQDRLARVQHFFDALQVTIRPRESWDWLHGDPAKASLMMKL